jgi:hypothetical protein
MSSHEFQCPLAPGRFALLAAALHQNNLSFTVKNKIKMTTNIGSENDKLYSQTRCHKTNANNVCY